MFRMKVLNTSTTLRKSNKLGNVDTISRDQTNHSTREKQTISKIMAIIVNSGLNVVINFFDIQKSILISERGSMFKVLAFCWIYVGYIGLYIVMISRCIV